MLMSRPGSVGSSRITSTTVNRARFSLASVAARSRDASPRAALKDRENVLESFHGVPLPSGL